MFSFSAGTGVGDMCMLIAFVVGGVIGWIFFDDIRDKIQEIYLKYKK